MFLQRRKDLILESLGEILPNVLASLVLEYASFVGQPFRASQVLASKKELVHWVYDPVTDKTAWTTREKIEISSRPGMPFYLDHPRGPIHIVGFFEGFDGLLVTYGTELGLVVWTGQGQGAGVKVVWRLAHFSLVWRLAETDHFGLMSRDLDSTTFSVLSFCSSSSTQEARVVEKRRFLDLEHGEDWIVQDGHNLVAVQHEREDTKWTFWNIRTDEIWIEDTGRSWMTPFFRHVPGTDETWLIDQTIPENESEVVQVFEAKAGPKPSKIFDYPHELFCVSALDRSRFLTVSLLDHGPPSANVRSLVTGETLLALSGLQEARPFVLLIDVRMGIDQDWFVLCEQTSRSIPYVVCLVSGQARPLTVNARDLVAVYVSAKTGAIVSEHEPIADSPLWRHWF